jgi:RNA polymerase sigma-70 factor (ECF subfamily)
MKPDATTEAHESPLNYELALLECAAGREAAVAGIYENEGNRLRSVVRRIIRSGDNVEDIIHDAFVQILRDARSFDPSRGTARAWIYTIVRNTALKARKNAAREQPTDAEELLRDLDKTLPNPAARVAEYAELRDLLEALEPKRRASLIMAIIDGRTHAEVAAYLGVPLGTVKSWIRRELVALREQLK